MQKLFKNISHLDNKLITEYNISDDLMQENAANGLNVWVRKHLELGERVQILCGPGNNGADGLACARMLESDYDVSIFLPLGAKSKMAKIQLERAKKLHIKEDKKIKKASLHIDAFFGSGLTRELSSDIKTALKEVSALPSLKLSCDIPTGILECGDVTNVAFKANATVTMGALKSSLYSDYAKDYVGEIFVANLGVSRDLYEEPTKIYLLESSDLMLPHRDKQDTNKGSFGHLCVISGKKSGAAKLCAKAGFCFGAGLVTLVGTDTNAPEFLMQSESIASNATAVCVGMGLGECEDRVFKSLLSYELPLVCDADILADERLGQLLKNRANMVLTPHVKEFSKMCKILGFGKFSIDDIQANRLELAREFSLKFPQTLVLKGANTIIANNGVCFISPFGSNALSKGGSGDVLAGLIGSLLAQKRSPLNAAISGVLAHGLSLKKFKFNSYALMPEDIIQGVRCL